MKIIHITFSLNNAGKENMLVDIANEQSREGHDVALLVINDLIDHDLAGRIENNIHLFSLKRKNRSRSLIHILRFMYILNVRFRADVIHSHDPQLGLLLKFTSFIPALLTIHGPAFETSQMKYYRKLIAVSRSVKADVEIRSKNVCEIIYNGVIIDHIKQKSEVSGQDFNLVSVGRLDHEVKGQDLLIEAAYHLVFNKELSNAKFFIIGEGSSRIYLEELILKRNLVENVFLLGNRKRNWIYENLRYYDIFIQPSRLEGFGLTVTEAMAAKVPVIASDIEGPAEILGEGKYGMLFENNNYMDLALKIEKAIMLYSKGEMESMTESAYQYCQVNFGISRVANDYLEVYKRIKN